LFFVIKRCLFFLLVTVIFSFFLYASNIHTHQAI
jgi:hypothetical protein